MNKVLVFGLTILILLHFHQLQIQPAEWHFNYAFITEKEPPKLINKIQNYIQNKGIEKQIAQDIAIIIFETEYDYEIQASLIMAIIETESGWNSLAVSHVGAKGLMQVYLRVWLRYLLAHELIANENDIFDEITNIQIGIHILQLNLEEHDYNIRRALYGYYGASQAWYYNRVMSNQVKIKRELK